MPQIVRLTPSANVTFTASGAGYDPGDGDEQVSQVVQIRVVSPYGSFMYNGTVGWFDGMTAFYALRSTGLSIASSGTEQGIYVQKIGSYGEMDLGANSGWVYAVSGEGYAAITEDDYPNVSSGSYTVDSGDYILWRFTEDWTKDTDLNSAAASAGETNAVVLTPAATAKNGSAQVTLSASQLSDAVMKAKDAGFKSIVIDPVISGSAGSISVTLPRAPLLTMSGEAGISLTVDTTLGTVALSGAAIAAALLQTDGGTLTVRIEKVDLTSLTTAQHERLVGKTAYRVGILSGETSLTDLGDPIVISLPCVLQEGETPDKVTVLRLSTGNQMIKTPCTFDSLTGLTTFSTAFLGLYGAGYEAPRQSPFADVAQTDWFCMAVQYVTDNGLFNGTSQTAFSPDAPMTRGMLVTVLYRLEGEPAAAAENGYKDLAAGLWYTDAVLWAAKCGLVTGYGDELFGAEDSLTREQMASILYRYAGYKGIDVTATSDLSDFSDAAGVALWAVDALRWTTQEGLITGVTSQTLVPAMTATRAQMAEILLRFAQNFVK